MSGETAAGAKTCVFWDLDDCPIPDDLDPDSVCKNIISALANEGCGVANVEFKAYGSNETFPDAEISYKRKVTKHVREMLFDIYEWAMVNPKGSNLLLISKVARDVLKSVVTVSNLAHRDYNVFLAPPVLPDKRLLTFIPRSVWLWTNLSHGGSPSHWVNKRKLSVDTLTDSDNEM